MNGQRRNPFPHVAARALEPKPVRELEQTGTDTGGRTGDGLMNPWTIQDGPYWRNRAETLRRTADETKTFRPETRARMLQIAQDFDVRAKRADQRSGGQETAGQGIDRSIGHGTDVES
jgi:hypothetical protein